MIETRPVTMLCLSGGGLSGIDVHVGIALALGDLGIEVDVYRGTSAGAIAGAFLAAGLGSQEVERIVRGLETRDVKRRRFLGRLRAAWAPSVFVHKPIERLLGKYLPAKFIDLKTSLRVGVCSEQTGQCELISGGNLVPAVLASMSISGLWPAVERARIDGGAGALTDGGTGLNLPLPLAHEWAVYDRVILAIAKPALDHASSSALGRLMRNIDLMMEGQLRATVTQARALAKRHKLRLDVVRPTVQQTAGSLKFNHGLIDSARTSARIQLAPLEPVPAKPKGAHTNG